MEQLLDTSNSESVALTVQNIKSELTILNNYFGTILENNNLNEDTCFSTAESKILDSQSKITTLKSDLDLLAAKIREVSSNFRQEQDRKILEDEEERKRLVNEEKAKEEERKRQEEAKKQEIVITNTTSTSTMPAAGSNSSNYKNNKNDKFR